MKKIGRGVFAMLAAVGWLGLETWKWSMAASCSAAAPLQYQILRQIRRSEPGFTQGLIYRNGSLFESTGGYGSSGLNQIDPTTGQVLRLGKLSQEIFGEGLDSDGQSFYQLSWKEHRLYQWDLNGKLKGSVVYPYEGWGLTRIQSQGVWVSSDGSNTLYFFEHAPADLVTTGPNAASWVADAKLSVVNASGSGAKPESKLNELEFAQNAIFANIFQDNRIVRIDPATGCVSGELDASGLVKRAGIRLQETPESVLNGIAYRPETDTFFITGKNWPVIYEVRIFQKR